MQNIYYLFSVKDKYFTEFSYELKKLNPVLNFFGFGYAKNLHLKDPIYQHVSFVSDILQKKQRSIDETFLVNLEKTYQVNIANMIHADRHLMRFKKEKRLYIAQELLRVFIEDIERCKIDMVFAEAVDDFLSYFASFYCRHHHLKFFFAAYVGFAEKACFTGSIDAIPENFEDQFNHNHKVAKSQQLPMAAIDETLERYVAAKRKPSYFSQGKADYKPFRLSDIVNFLHYIKIYFRDRKGMHFERFPLLTPLYRMQRIWRQHIYKRFIKQYAIPQHRLGSFPYIIYPLHFEPEASTLIQGRWLHDQKKIIEILSKNIPANIIIIVKEHMASIGRRPLSFYRDIAKYHNVFFVDDKVDGYQLLDQAKGVAVISSTMGLEALMLKKPVISFGERFYNVSANVFCVENYKQIKETIQAFLQHSFDWQDVIALFYTLFSVTEDMGCLSHLDYTRKDLEIQAKALMRKLALP